MSEFALERPRRREADSLVGQFKQLWPVLVVVASTAAAGAVAWSNVKTKTYENTDEIVVVKRDVDALKQGFAAQTAILARVEKSVDSIDRHLRRRNREDGP